MTRLLSSTILAAAALAACGSDPLPANHVTLGSLGFDVPADWKRHDETRQGVAISEWEPADNERKQSVTVIRTLTSPAVAKAGVPAVLQLLAAAQRSLPEVKTSPTSTLTTASGMPGARIAIDFVPAQAHERYHRIHVVLVDGAGALVHVIYTAQSPDQRALELVLDTIRRQEA